MRRRDARFGAGLAALALGLTSIGFGIAASLPATAAADDGVSQTPDPSPSPTETPSESPEPSEEPLPSPTTTSSPSEAPDPEDDETDGELVVDDAQFNWSLSQQTNAQSHNPGVNNFLGAGVANPGRGGVHLTQSRWSARSGNVTIQKQTAAGAWRTATWDGLGTDAHGETIGLYGPFSGHRVNIISGLGTVNPAEDDASIAWKGTFTVVYYGGNTVFTLTDPVLEVEDGKGTLRATAGGWIADRNNPSTWNPATPKKVTVADLSDVDVTKDGLVVTPDYEGVKVTGTEPQRRTGQQWGAFPQSLIDYLVPLNTDQFWYSTGLQSDWTKLPAPIQAGWNGRLPEVPGSSVPPKSTKKPKPTNAVVAPPTSPPTSGGVSPRPVVPSTGTGSGPKTGGVQGQPPVTVPAPGSDVPVAAGSAGQVVGPRTTVVADVPLLDSALTSSTADGAVGWWVGGGLLLASAGMLLTPIPRRRTP